MLKMYEELVSQGKVKKTKLSVVRVKLHIRCQWSCHFCHMEGNHYSDSIDDLDELLYAIELFRKNMGINEVHLTGGEPSIHPRIVDIVQAIYREGFTVKMTTNGITYKDRYLECIDVGLSGINVSVNTLNPEALGKLMEPAQSTSWGKKALNAQLSLCEMLVAQINVKINTCVGVDESEAMQVAAFAKKNGFHWRPMNQLEISKESYKALERMCRSLDSRPIIANITDGSSSFSVVMVTSDGFTFSVKLIRPFVLQTMCEDCSINRRGECYEYVYGPRIEKDANGLKVRNCLHRHSAPYVLSVRDFFKHPIFEEMYTL